MILPMKNKVPNNIPNKDKWEALKRAVNNIVDRYVTTHEIDQLSERHPYSYLLDSTHIKHEFKLNIRMHQLVNYIQKEL